MTTATSAAESFVGNDIGTDLQHQQNIDSCTINDDEAGILAALFGSSNSRDHFFEHYFGRRVAYFPRLNELQLQQQSQQQQLEPPIRGIDLPNLYKTNEWTSLRKRGSQDMLDKSQMTYTDLSHYIAQGGSIVIPVTPDDYLHPAKLQIERAFGLEEETGTSVNIYHSGPSAVALNVHYDSWPVFVLQLEGEKEWVIQDGAFGEMKIEEIDAKMMWRNVTLTEGDLLYIPKGVHHAATTAEGFGISTHATIGLTP